MNAVKSRTFVVMKKCYILFLSWLVALAANGQTLTVSSNQLNFGTVTETNPDSLSLTIYNNMGKTVNVTDIKFFLFYGSPAFSASQFNFSIADGSSQMIWIKFAPLHNIYHNSELVIENDGQRGPVSVDLIGQGHYTKSYYNTTENLAEEPLKTQIQTITGQNYNSMGYNDGRDTMFMFIDNQKVNGQGASQNTLACVYTGRLAVGYTDRTDCQNNDQFNTEHTFPQGFFSSAEPMKSDLHHLFPTDDLANNTRANFPFGIVTNATWQQGGSKFDNNTDIFEPRDDHKGTVARSMMYFVLRYQNYNSFMDSQESILKTWNKNFLPSTIEINRNNKIALYQQNRNPFVDYPQFADRINSFSNTSSAPVDYSFEKYDNTINFGSVATGASYIYSFIVVNDGNQPLQLSNFTLSNISLLSFNSGGSNNTLAPGEAYKTEITLSPVTQGNINETLTFDTNSPNSVIVQVPLSASAFTASLSEISNVTLIIAPNPADNFINVKCTDQLVNNLVFTMTNKLGQPVPINITENNNSYTIDLQSLAGGFYLQLITTDIYINKRSSGANNSN